MAKASYVWSGTEWVAVASAFPTANQRFIKDSAATTYTLDVNDTGKALVISNTDPITVTIPADATYDFVIGQTFIVVQRGSGVVTIAGAVGVTLRSKSSYVKTSGQYSEVRLLKLATNEWLLSGDLSS